MLFRGRQKNPNTTQSVSPLEPEVSQLLHHFADDTLDEIHVNGSDSLFASMGDRLEERTSPFTCGDRFIDWLQELAWSQLIRLDPQSPFGGGILDTEGYGRLRWHAVLPPLVRNGPIFSLRRHRFSKLTLDHFMIQPHHRRLIAKWVPQGGTVLVTGPTSSGKTSFLVALLKTYAARERVVVIESLEEIPQISPYWILMLEKPDSLAGTGGVSMERLVQEAMRLRPDRLVAGEVRGHEAAALLQCASSGHRGVMATIHGSSGAEAISRLAMLASQGERSTSTDMVLRHLGEVMVVTLTRGTPPHVIQVEVLGRRPVHGASP